MTGSISWTGRLPARNSPLATTRPLLRRAEVDQAGATTTSPYAPRFTNGATLFPRLLVMVEEEPTGPLGAGAGRRAVRSHRSPNEKKPWKGLPDLVGSIERQFVRPVHLGDTILPFRELSPGLGVVPWDGQRLLHGGDDRLDLYPGLATWWRRAEQLWKTHRVSEKMSLLDRVDYQRTLQNQFPAGPHRVVYSKGGMYMAAARVSNPEVVIENTLYWATTSGLDEARYLTAILNSTALLELVRPLQARGEHNPRHFDKYVFQVPIPSTDPTIRPTPD